MKTLTMAEPKMVKLNIWLIKLNMNEIIMTKIKMVKIIMTRPTMVKLLIMNKMKLAKIKCSK
jgi:hypothetical protein